MGRNRALGTPYEIQEVSASFITEAHVDLYAVEASIGSPVTVTLDPNAFNGDQVIVQDAANNAGTQSITIVASTGQTILDGVGSSYVISKNGGGVQLTFDRALSGWLPQAIAISPGGGGETTEVVFRPGVATAAPVYETWAEIVAAVQASPVPVAVFVDSSMAEAHVPAATGTSNMLGTTTIAAFHNTTADLLIIDDGATLLDVLGIANQLAVATNGTSTPAFTWSPDASFYVNNASISNSGSGNAALVPSQLTVFIMGNDGFIGSNGGDGAFFLVPADALLFLTLTTDGSVFGTLADGTSDPTSTVSIGYDASTFIDPTNFPGYGGTLSFFRSTQASIVNPAIGTTLERPTGVDVLVPGQQFFDTTLNALITWNGTAWVTGVFATLSASQTPATAFNNAFTTIMTLTYTASAGEFAIVSVSSGLIGGDTASGFIIEATCTGQTTQFAEADGPFAVNVETTIPLVCKFGPLAAGSTTIAIRAQTIVHLASATTATGNMVVERSLN